MKAFLWITMALWMSAFICRFIFLCHGKYPRTVTNHSWHDTFDLLCTGAMTAWAAYLLWNL